MRAYKKYEFYKVKELIEILKKREETNLVYAINDKLKITNLSPERLDEKGLIGEVNEDDSRFCETSKKPWH